MTYVITETNPLCVSLRYQAAHGAAGGFRANLGQKWGRMRPQ